MRRIEHTIAIGPPIDKVFDFITEHEPPVRSAAATGGGVP